MLNNKLTSILNVSNSSTLIYTNNNYTTTLLKGFIVHNYSGSDAVLKLNVVFNNSGSIGTASVTNQLYEINIPSKETLEKTFPYVLFLDDNNDSVHIQASVNSALNFILLGDVIS